MNVRLKAVQLEIAPLEELDMSPVIARGPIGVYRHRVAAVPPTAHGRANCLVLPVV